MAKQNSFNFTAKFVPYKENSKMQTLTVKEESGYKRLSIMLSDGTSTKSVGLGKSIPKVKDGQQKIYVQLKDGETGKYKFTGVDYNKRFEADIVDNVNPFKKFVLDLGEDNGGRKEFIFEVDYIDAVYEAIKNGLFNNKVLFVSGEVERKRYNGKTQTNFIPSFIKYAKEDAKLGLFGRQSIIFDKESLDSSMIKTDYKFEVNGWIEYYSNDHKKNLMFPEKFTFDFSAIKDSDNKEGILKIVEFMKSKFNVRKGYYEYGFDVMYLDGTEQVAIELKDLSKDLQMQIELGITTLEAVKRDKGMIGERKTQIRLIKPDNRNYEEVLQRDELDDEDFIMRDVVEIKDVKDIEIKPEPNVEVVSNELDDLFASLV